MMSMTFDFTPERLALTVTETAEALGVSKPHVYRAIARGEIPARRLGRRLMIPSVALMRFLDVPHPAPGVDGGGPAVEPPVPTSP